MSEVVREKVYAYSGEIIRQSHYYIESIIERVDIINSQLIALSLDSKYLFYPSLSLEVDDVLEINAIESQLHSLKKAFPVIHNISLIGDGERYISSSYDFDIESLLSEAWFTGALELQFMESRLHIHTAGYANRALENPPRVLSVIRKYSLYGDVSKTAIILLDLDYGILTSQLADIDLGEGANLIVAYQENEVLFESNPNESMDRFLLNTSSPMVNMTSGSNIEERDGSIIIHHEIPRFGWIVGVFPCATLLGEMVTVRNILLLMTITLGILAVFLSYVITNNITKPLYRLEMAMKKVQAGDFSIQVSESGNRDLLNLIRSYNVMSSEIQALMNRIVVQERETVKAELIALQSQVNPHFLYNTLDTIRGIAYSQDSKIIADITNSLASLFRYGTCNADRLVPLREEIEYFNHYVRIQKYRFADRFKLRFEIEKETLSVPILRFILQPLVENSFKHGIESKAQGGRIYLRVKKTSNEIIIRIEDNGAGISPERLEILRRDLKNGNESKNNGIGLVNVNNRIRLYYGEPYGVSVDSICGKGTTVEVRLPLKDRDNAQA
jgi:two-component system sensor histidine kinase YesM